MARNLQHDLLTSPSAEIRARQRFVLALKRSTEQLRRRYVGATDASFHASADDPETAFKEAVSTLYQDEAYKALCRMKRTGQDMMWQTISDSLQAELPRLRQLYAETGHSNTGGTLSLAADSPAPGVWEEARVHLQPGGYMLNDGDDDIMAGALYEEGGTLYSRGQGLGTRESKAECIIRFLKTEKPTFKPTRILDIACSAGASAIPYALEYPEAEVHAIDIGPGLLRYAHAKAQALNAPVHFHQMNAESIDFPDGSFDLVVSHNAMHEMSAKTQQTMFDESFRLLKEGGICIHQDLPVKFSEMSPVRQADVMFDEWYNGELFWSEYAGMDCAAGLEKAGFDQEMVECRKFPLLDGTMHWLLAVGEKKGSEA